MGKMELVSKICACRRAEGLIECDYRFIKGFKPLGTGSGRTWAKKWERYCPEGKRFAKRIVKFKDFFNQPHNFRLPVHDHLADWVRQGEVLRGLVVRSGEG